MEGRREVKMDGGRERGGWKWVKGKRWDGAKGIYEGWKEDGNRKEGMGRKGEADGGPMEGRWEVSTMEKG